MTAARVQKKVSAITGKEAKLRSLEEFVASAGVAPSEFVPLVRQRLAKMPNPDLALNNFLRFISSGFTSSLIRDFSHHPVLIDIALTLFSHSQYLADILVRNPELFHWLTSTDALSTHRTREHYGNEAKNAMLPFGRTDKKIDGLKRFHRREILRISARDILKRADLETVTRELSWLADAVIDAILSLAHAEIGQRFGRTGKNPLVVIGLGKLGGEELNFSSDIDLMIAYDADGEEESGGQNASSFHEYCCRIAEFLVRKLSDHTDEGHLYRVDMRLRPDGSSGPLAMSVQGFERYYETRGEIWERQMLLKARIVAGNREVENKWFDALRPFVYPSTVLHNPLEELRLMKQRIESRIGDHTNVKLSKGGIRDIEFVVQSLQLLRSGVDETIRERNTLHALDNLMRAGLLNENERGKLRKGYLLLREVEHRLQLLHGAQTHALPENKSEMHFLAKRLGFASTDEFKKSLLRTQIQVRKIFDSVLQYNSIRKSRPGREAELSVEDLVRLAARSGFLEPKGAADSLRRLMDESELFRDRESIEKLLKCLKKYRASDWGLANLRILCASPTVKSIVVHSIRNEYTLELLVNICSRSKRLAQRLASEPLLFESMLGQADRFFQPGLEWDYFLKSDPFRFRNFNESKAVIRFLTMESSLEELCHELTEIADTVVRSIADEMIAKHPERPNELLIVALGKYGGEELLVGSDLDIMILYEQSGEFEPSYEKSAREFVQAFSSTGEIIYDIDLRLRPEGKNAPLATEFSYYVHYLRRRAQAWEKQALLKARSVHGGDRMKERFSSLRSSEISNVITEEGWLAKIIEMRKRMEVERTKENTVRSNLKVSKGGIVDLEFLTQAMQLEYHSRYPSLNSANAFNVFRGIPETRILAVQALKILRYNYLFLRKLELGFRLNSESKEFVLPREGQVLECLASFMNEKSAKDLTVKITRIRKQNRFLMESVLSKLKAP